MVVDYLNKEIAERIELIKQGRVPEGYKKYRREIISQDWGKHTVKEAMSIKNNLRIPISEQERKKIQGTYPYYGPTRIQDYINRYNIEGEHVLIGEDGDHFLKYKDKEMTLLVDGKFNVNNHAHILKGTEVCKTKWFYYFFQHRNIMESITRQGVGRYKLTKEALQDIEMYLPVHKEQEKIIQILQIWDRAITLKEQLIREKESQKKALKSKLLIDTSTSEWRQLRLGDILEEKKEITVRNNQYPVLTSSRTGLFLQSEYFSKQIASNDNIGYKVVRKGDFTYRAMSDDGKFTFNQLEEYDIGIVSPAYAVFGVRLDYNDVFIKEILNSSIFTKYIAKKIQGGTRLSLKYSSLASIQIKTPDLAKQIEIARKIELASKEIALLKQEVEALKKQKRGLMQLLLTGIVRVNE